MRPYGKKIGSALLAALLAASIASPLTVWADQSGPRDNQARAKAQAQDKQAQDKQAKQRAEQQAKERERAEREKAQKLQQERERQERQEKERQEIARQERERSSSRVLGSVNPRDTRDTHDAKPSDHPSGKDRNEERGASFPQGASRSNPDGGGIDKPFAVGSLAAGSQGRGDFDGNNGCGNDNDFADDNNGNCGGRQAQTAASQLEQKHELKAANNDNDKHDKKTEVAGTQIEPTKIPSAHDQEDREHNRHKKHHWWARFMEWCREVLAGKDKPKPEVAGVQVQSQSLTPTPPPTSTPKSTATPQVSGAKAIPDHECIPTEWHWVMTQLDRVEDAPLAISVTWANGQTMEVSRTAFTGKVAHYATNANLTSAVVNATTVAPAGWAGQFNLSHGPCFGVLGTQSIAEPSQTPLPTSTPLPTNTPQPTATASPTASPTAPPTHTAQPTATLGSGVQAQALVNHECIASEWHFLITQLDSESQAPAFIRVTWANGQTLDVARTGFTGKTAHYTIAVNLNSRVTSAVAGTALPSGWSGQFNLSHGPCL